jgi:hypothetical protein
LSEETGVETHAYLALNSAIEDLDVKEADWSREVTGLRGRQCAAAAAPLGGRFIRKTKGMTTNAEIPNIQKLSR